MASIVGIHFLFSKGRGMKELSDHNKLIVALPIFVLVLFSLLAFSFLNIGVSGGETFTCGSSSSKIWDIDLSFEDKEGNKSEIKLRVPEGYVLELSRTKEKTGAANLHAKYDTLEPPCIDKNGINTASSTNNLLSLYLQAKPKGSTKSIQYAIDNTRASWKKIEDEEHPTFDHYIREKGIRPKSVLIPKSSLSEKEMYYLQCQGIIPQQKFKNSTCRVNFSYKDILNVGAGFPVSHIEDAEQAIQKASKLLDKFSAAGSQGE